MNKYTKYISFVLGFLIVILNGCSASTEPETMEQKYDLAIQNIDKGNYSAAIPLLQAVINENPGTRYASYSYLKLGDAHVLADDNKLDEAEMNYRIFLNYNSHSHLVPYVLSRLIELNFKRNISSMFGKEYAFSRDPDHFKKIIMEYQRFYFLYPDSLYLKDAENYLNESVEALAEHEFIIGNWYFNHSLFTPAIHRYRYIMSHYPNFKNWKKVVVRLIEAYRKNQQTELADELERVYNMKLAKMTVSLN